ncbi:MAG: hypothetical protein WCS86_02040 [Candidatus Paceibacterota bacterium]
MKNKNLKLFKYSLQKPEPLIDDAYIKSADIIISPNGKKPNKLMINNIELLENISAYKVSKKSGNTKVLNEIISNIRKCLATSNINYSEFSSFWSVADVSYSTYKKLSEVEQSKFLKYVVEKYLEDRHGMYLEYGYTPTTLQVSKDAKAHKQSGPLGIRKVGIILNTYGFKALKKLDIESFLSQNLIYINTDKTGKKLFKEIIKKCNLNFKWEKKTDGKMPDVLFKKKKDLFIVEHKHMKEGGGGQNKQINEVIDFINYSEKTSFVKVHYVTFLDGQYFNYFADPNFKEKSKIPTQVTNIKNALQKNPDNYFVNTDGFKKLLSELK